MKKCLFLIILNMVFMVPSTRCYITTNNTYTITSLSEEGDDVLQKDAFFGCSIDYIHQNSVNQTYDVLVGAYGAYNNSGAAYIVQMEDYEVKSFIELTSNTSSFGYSVHARTYETYNILVVGAVDGYGSVFVYYSDDAYEISHEAVISGSDYCPVNSSFGSDVSFVDDVDGDDVDDLAVGAFDYDDEGVVFIMFMNTVGGVQSYVSIESQGTLFDQYGIGVSYVQSDDDIDLVVGASGVDDGVTLSGAVFILKMQTGGVVDTYVKISNLSGSFTAPLGAGDQFGYDVSYVSNIDGDIDSDEIGDIIVGSPFEGSNNRGAVYILMLQTEGNVKTWFSISSTSGGLDPDILFAFDWFGVAVSSFSDDFSDGYLDILVGAERDNGDYLNTGSFYILKLIDVAPTLSPTQSPTPSSPTPSSNESSPWKVEYTIAIIATIVLSVLIAFVWKSELFIHRPKRYEPYGQDNFHSTEIEMEP